MFKSGDRVKIINASLKDFGVKINCEGTIICKSGEKEYFIKWDKGHQDKKWFCEEFSLLKVSE